MPKVVTSMTLDAETVAQWRHVARLEGRSLSATVNDWLEQIFPAALQVASQIDSDKEASKRRVLALVGAVQAVHEEAQTAISKATRKAAKPGLAAVAADLALTPSPRLVIRGGNSTKGKRGVA